MAPKSTFGNNSRRQQQQQQLSLNDTLQGRTNAYIRETLPKAALDNAYANIKPAAETVKNLHSYPEFAHMSDEELRKAVAEATKECEEMTKRIEQKRLDRENAQANKNAHEACEAAFDKLECEKLKYFSPKIRKQIEGLETLLAETASEKEAEKANYRKDIEKLSKEKAGLEQQNQNMDLELQHLAIEKTALEEHVSSITKRLSHRTDSKERELALYKQLLVETQERAHGQDELIKELLSVENRTALGKTAVGAVSQQNETHPNETTRPETILNDSRDEDLQVIQQPKRHYETEAAEMRDTILQLKKDLKKSEDIRLEQHLRIGKIALEKKNLIDHCRTLEETNKDLSSDIRSYDQTIDNLEKERNAARSERDLALADLESMRENIKVLKDRCDSTGRRRNELQTERDALVLQVQPARSLDIVPGNQLQSASTPGQQGIARDESTTWELEAFRKRSRPSADTVIPAEIVREAQDLVETIDRERPGWDVIARKSVCLQCRYANTATVYKRKEKRTVSCGHCTNEGRLCIAFEPSNGESGPTIRLVPRRDADPDLNMGNKGFWRVV